ncbi:MAG: c-type cytochrome [Acidobacteriia bacterium]|nr:c-type cytochrome [Terriglobia bacterium]
MVILSGVFTEAQSIVEHGSDVFAKSCASGYCHGTNGQGGGAPKLAARGFDEAFIITTTRAGVPGTAMQGYGTVLARPDFNAVVAYVAKLNGIEPRTNEAPARVLSAEALRGRELFSDPLRGFARCSTCHVADGLGIAVAPLAHAGIVNVSIDGDTFPALVVSRGGRRISLYDLSVLPPVQRTVDAGAVKIGEAAAWRHPAESYNDAELKAIATFLKAVR